MKLDLANQWVKVLEFFDDGTKVSGIEGADRFRYENCLLRHRIPGE